MELYNEKEYRSCGCNNPTPGCYDTNPCPSARCADGKSAYELAGGNAVWGCLENWLASLKGPMGPQGMPGTPGATGPQGCPGIAGTPGAKGDTGATGATGPQGLAGVAGITPTIGGNGNWFINNMDTGVPAKGTQGATGAQGPMGATGAQRSTRCGWCSWPNWNSGCCRCCRYISNNRL
jgi:hypothetical protein